MSAATRFIVDAEWCGDRWRLLEATAEQVCECGHLLSAHAPGLKCRTCRNECGIDAATMFGVAPVEHVGVHEVAMLVLDELELIDAACVRLDEHASWLTSSSFTSEEAVDMAERIEADTHVVAQAALRVRELAALFTSEGAQ